MPIEESYLDAIESIRNEIGEEDFRGLQYNNHFAVCWNIHKSLKPYILSRLKEKGISEDFIYPNSINLKQFTVSSVLEEL